MSGQSVHSRETAKRKSRSILIGSLVAVVIAITPYLFYTYEYFPDTPSFETGLFTYESKFNLSIYVTMWLLMGKLIPLLLLILWFFTCKHWWYHVLLIPIAMFAFQIFSAITDDTKIMDEAEIYWLLPIMMVIIPFVYLIRVKLFDKHVLGIDLEAMEAELQSLKEKQASDHAAKEKKEEEEPIHDSKRYRTLTEKIEQGLSTENIERQFKKWQHSMRSFLHL